MNTIERGINSWGLLIESSAIRDFNIQSERIKTNEIEFVLKSDYPIKFQNQEIIFPLPVKIAVPEVENQMYINHFVRPVRLFFFTLRLI